MTPSVPLAVADGTPRGAARALAVAAVLGGAAVLLEAVLFRGRSFFERDVHLLYLPLHASLRQALGQGAWPWWDPNLGFGQPLASNPAAAVFYPVGWLQPLVSAQAWYSIFVALHLGLAGLGALRLARHAGLSLVGGVAAALAWMASGPLLSLVNVWPHFGGAALAPWVVTAADRALVQGGARRTIAWGALVAAQVVVGSADVGLLTLLVCFALGVARSVKAGWPAARAPIGIAAIAGVVALALSAVQWLPALEALRASDRLTATAAQRAGWSIHPLTLAQLALPVTLDLIPRLAPGGIDLDLIWQSFLRSIYVGLPVLVLALRGLFVPHRLRTWAAGVGAVAGLFALGPHTPIHTLLVTVVPGMGVMRYPAKAMVLVALCVALLAGLGVDTVGSALRGRREHLARTWAVGGLALTMIALALVTWGAARAGTSSLPAAAPIAVAAACAAAVAALAGTRLARWKGAPLVAAGLAFADLAWAHHGLNPTAPRSFFEQRPAILSLLPEGARVYAWDYSVRAARARPRVRESLAFGRPTAGTGQLQVAEAAQAYLYPWSANRWLRRGSFEADPFGLQPQAMRNFVFLLRGLEDSPLFTRLLRISSVQRVVSLHDESHEGLVPVGTVSGPYPLPIRVFAVPDALPAAYVVSGARTADEGEQAYLTLLSPEFDERREVVLPTAAGAAPIQPAFVGTATIQTFAADRIVVDVSASHDGWLVLTEAFDAGWHARVDGAPATVLPANTVFRAVPVRAGRHRVDLRYWPRTLVVGAWLTLATALACVVVWCAARSASVSPVGVR